MQDFLDCHCKLTRLEQKERHYRDVIAKAKKTHKIKEIRDKLETARQNQRDLQGVMETVFAIAVQAEEAVWQLRWIVLPKECMIERRDMLTYPQTMALDDIEGKYKMLIKITSDLNTLSKR